MNFAATLTTIIVGGTVFLTAVVALARAIFKQASSTDSNAKAIDGLARSNSEAMGSLVKSIDDLGRKIEHLDRRVDQHDVDIAVLRDRRHWGGGS